MSYVTNVCTHTVPIPIALYMYTKALHLSENTAAEANRITSQSGSIVETR